LRLLPATRASTTSVQQPIQQGTWCDLGSIFDEIACERLQYGSHDKSGLDMQRKPQELREKAKRCKAQVAIATDAAIQTQLLAIANIWRGLAEQIEHYDLGKA
jgi:hypothetical protein